MLEPVLLCSASVDLLPGSARGTQEGHGLRGAASAATEIPRKPAYSEYDFGGVKQAQDVVEAVLKPYVADQRLQVNCTGSAAHIDL